MKNQNQTSSSRWQGILSIVNCRMIIAMSLLLSASISVSAQDEETEGAVQQNTVRTIVSKKKQYPTRTIKGRVIDASTKQGVGGAIVSADGIDGYSGLTKDDGSYELKVPEFATSIYIVSPDHNPQRMGLQDGESQFDAKLQYQTS